FVVGLPARAAALERAHGQGDVDALRRLAHQLKGSAGGYGFTPITIEAGRLEQALRDERLAGEVGASLERLTALCARARRPIARPSAVVSVLHRDGEQAPA